jgi:hypothetical protein
LAEVDVTPLQAEQLALSQAGGYCQENQRSFSDAEVVDQSLDFSGRQDSWCSASLCTLTDEVDWIAVKQLVPAGVIKQDGHQIPNLGATTLCQRQTSKPRFNLYCPDLSQFVVSPLWADPSVQICLIGFLRCVTAPGIVLCEFPLLKVIAELCDRNRAIMNPRLLRIDLCQQDSDSRTGGSFVWIAINGADYPLPLDTRSTQTLL